MVVAASSLPMVGGSLGCLYKEKEEQEQGGGGEEEKNIWVFKPSPLTPNFNY